MCIAKEIYMFQKRFTNYQALLERWLCVGEGMRG